MNFSRNTYFLALDSYSRDLRLGGDANCCSIKREILVVKACKPLGKLAFGEESAS